MPKIKLKIKFRPGWHIEDTAITEKELGQQYDLHGGGSGLIFPHHEAEIAQMESISGKKPFVKYWMHTGLLNVNSEKMAKSLGNFTTIKDALKNYNKETIRYLFASSNYKNQTDFTQESLENAKNNVSKINEFVLNIKNYKSKSKDFPNTSYLITATKTKFEEAMDDDFETANALTVIFNFIKEVNKLIAEEKLSTKDCKTIKKFMDEINSIFGIIEKEVKIPKNILELVEKRNKAREEKNYRLADEIRQLIVEEGYYIDDSKSGTIIKKL